MEQICTIIEKINFINNAKINIADWDIIDSKKNRLIGIVLNSDIIILDTKFLFSSRLKWENIEFLKPLTLRKLTNSINRKYLEEYFNSNNDNPYALINTIHCITKNREIGNLTQFPPIDFKQSLLNRNTKLEQLFNKINFGDLVFTFDPTSTIHRLIRNIDQSPFSHVGIIGKNNFVYEMTTSGAMQTSFYDRFSSTSEQIAIYRYKDITITNENKEKMQQYLDESIHRNIPFDYGSLILIFLRKRLKMRFINFKVSIADTLYKNNLNLIGYV